MKCFLKKTYGEMIIRKCFYEKFFLFPLSFTGINESKLLTKHISWKWKCKFGKRKWNSNQKQNDKCLRECKKKKKKKKKIVKYVKKISFGILLHVLAKMVKYLASLFDDDSMIRCDETIEE